MTGTETGTGPIGDAAPDYLIGQVISECKVLEKVGEGGFGTVYKAIDQNLQRPVALKVMLRSLSTNQEFVQKFIREAVTAAQLNHPNIVGIHKVDLDERRGLHYLIMEFVEGITLSDMVDEKGVLGIEETVPLMLQAADALATAHEHNIVHRDIKPENLMVTKAGQVKITDFGLAKSLSSDQKTTKVMGTPHYMSPEQFEGKAVDGRSDIYSLGVTFYFLLSKDRPYAGENTVQIIYSILTQQPKPLTEANDKVSPGLWQIVQKMIAKEPGDRYQSLRETIEDLRAFRARHLSEHASCAQCGARNTKGRKFCRSCGGPLLVKCPSCDSLEPVGVTECTSCGAAIERLVKIEKSILAAKRFEALGDLRRAAESYQQVVEIDPAHADATRELGRLGETLEEVERVRTEADGLMGTGEVELAISRVDDLMRRFPGSAEVREHRDQLRQTLSARKVNALLGEAEEAMEAGDVQGALSTLDKALHADPSREDVRGRRNELAQRLSTLAVSRQKAARALAAGRFKEAFHLATDVLRLSPGDSAMEEVVRKSKDSIASVDEFVNRARELAAEGRLDDALAELESALSLRPGDPQIFGLVEETRGKIQRHRERLSLCRRLMAERNFREAARGLSEILDKRPDDVEVRSLLAACEKGLEETVRHEQVEQYLVEGRRLYDRGDLSGALNAFAGVLQLDPNNDEARSQRGSLEARMREERDVRSLANEHLQDGRYDEAVLALQRLRDVNPAHAGEIDREIAEAKERATQTSGQLRLAEESLAQRAYDRALEAASRVLELAPRNPRAVAIKKDAEKALKTIHRFLTEADRLIASELFDEAIESLDKARARGASPDEYRARREQCEQGRMALLKSDATRSLVVKDFEAAIAAYEQVLEVNRGDSDALKGKRTAERRMRILTTEPLALRVGSAAVVMMMLGLAQLTAVGSTKQGVADAVTQTSQAQLDKATVTKADTGKQVADPTAALRFEALRKFADAARAWQSELDEFAGEAELELGVVFNEAMVAAAAKGAGPDDFAAKLTALGALEDLAGKSRLRARNETRRKSIALGIDAYVAAWRKQAEAIETADPGSAVSTYNQIISHPVARLSKESDPVQDVLGYLSDVTAGNRYLGQQNFEQAAVAYGRARVRIEGQLDREHAVDARLGGLDTDWLAHLRKRAAEIGRDDDETYYNVVIRGLQRYSSVRNKPLEQVAEDF